MIIGMLFLAFGLMAWVLGYLIETKKSLDAPVAYLRWPGFVLMLTGMVVLVMGAINV